MYQFCLFALLVGIISAQAPTTLWSDGLPAASPLFDSMISAITPFTDISDRLDDVDNETTAFFPGSDQDAAIGALTEEEIWYLLADGIMEYADILALFQDNYAFGDSKVTSLRDGTWFRLNGYGGSLAGGAEDPKVLTINGIPFVPGNVSDDNGIVWLTTDIPKWNVDMSKSVVEHFASEPTFSKLSALLTASGLGAMLPDNAAVTLFAPTDDAFTELETLLGAENYTALTTLAVNAQLLADILSKHVAGGVFFSTPLYFAVGTTVSIPGVTFDTDNAMIDIQVPLDLGNDPVLVSVGGSVNVNATITGTDVHRSNGVIHTINKVLLADDFDASMIQHDSGNDTTTGDATTGDATTGDATTGDATTGDATTGDATTGDATTGDATTGDATTGDATTGDATTGDATTAATTAAATTAAATTAAATTAAATTGAPPTTDSAATLVAGVLVLLALLL